MNFVSLTNRYGRKVIIRWDTILSMTEEVVSAVKTGFPDEKETWTVIRYGEFGMARDHEVVVKENTQEIMLQIATMGETKIDPQDSYYSLLEVCEKIAAHNLEPAQAVALVQSFIHERMRDERERLGRESMGREQDC